MKDAAVRHRFEQIAACPVMGLFRVLPHAVSRGVGRALGRLTWAALGERRRIALDNLAQALPELSPARRRSLARASCEHLGLAAADFFSASRFGATDLCDRTHIEGWENFLEAEAQGKGVFLTTGHIGLWEATQIVVALYRGSFLVIARPLDNPHLERRVWAIRTRFGSRVVPVDGAVREMLRTLRVGGRVGVLIDQRTRRPDAVEVPFFGRPARTSSTLARLSIRTGAPVIPAYGFPEPRGRYRVVLRPSIEPPSDRDAADEENVRTLTAIYMAAVEEEIRRQPHLWMWVHDRWRS